MAADPDPYFALPKLYGAPAYARPPRVVPESERPFDPDDLPIAAEMTDEELAYAQSTAPGAGAWSPAWAPAPVDGYDGPLSADAGDRGGATGRFSLRAVAGRLGSRPK